MNNDIGMIKPILTPAAQASPAASMGKAGSDLQQKAAADSVREAKEAAQEKEPLEDVVSDLNKLVRELHRELRFSVDKDSGDTVIKVIDRETDEVVRQIPSEELIHLRKRLQDAAGVFFQDSA